MTRVISQVCIVGGGFGGLYTALSLSRYSLVKTGCCKVTLIEPKSRFLFSPLLYELLTKELEPWEIAPSYQKLLQNTSITWIQDQVQQINLSKRTLRLAQYPPQNYDYLVLTGGRQAKAPPTFTYPYQTFRSLADAEEILTRIESLLRDRSRISIAIVGAGANGVELACKLSDRLGARGKIFLIDQNQGILKNFNSGIQKAANKALAARNIEICLNSKIQATAADTLKISSPERQFTQNFEQIIWTVGTASHPWVKQLNCQKNSWGQLLTCPTLQLIDYPEVLALGDIAEIQQSKTKIVPNTAQAAYQQAPLAARNLLALMQGHRLKGFVYYHLGDMLTLGKGKGLISSFGFNLAGSLGGLLRRLIYIYRLPTLRHRLQVGRKFLIKLLRHD
ncbi:MAG: FAD-dependent oxidoreductase [Cyanobacteria bacterium J06623_7]